MTNKEAAAGLSGLLGLFVSTFVLTLITFGVIDPRYVILFTATLIGSMLLLSRADRIRQQGKVHP